MKFNEKLLDLRKKKGWSQEEIGYKLNVSRQTISKWEAGQTTPELEKLRNLSKIFGISVDELINEEENNLEEVEIQNNNLKLDDNKKAKKKFSKRKLVLLYIMFVLILFYIVLVTYRFFIIIKIGESFYNMQQDASTRGYYLDKRTFGNKFSEFNSMTKEEHFYFINWFYEDDEDKEIARVKIKKYSSNLLNAAQTIYVDNIWIHSDERSKTTEFDETNKTYKELKDYEYSSAYNQIMAEYESMFNTLDFYEDWPNYFKYAMNLGIEICKTKEGDYYMSNEKINTLKQKDNCYIMINDKRIILEKIVYDQEMKANSTGTRYKLRIGDIEEKDVQFPDLSSYTFVE